MNKLPLLLTAAALSSVALFFGGLVSGPAFAQASYEECAAATEANPAKALEEAKKWRTAQGSTMDQLGGLHCEAMALSALGRHEEAANALSELAEAMPNASVEDRAAIWVQAGASFLSAKKIESAEQAYDKAIELQPENTDNLMDRGQIRALRDDWAGVRSDMGAVLAEHPNSARALTLRATASRMMGKKEAALADAERAISIAPHDPSALLERGLAYEANGYKEKAKADWENVIYFAQARGRSGDPAIEEARAYIAGVSSAR